MLTPLDQLRQHLAGAAVDLVGNGPSATQWQPTEDRAIVTVNAGLKLLDQHDAGADLYWVQDERFVDLSSIRRSGCADVGGH